MAKAPYFEMPERAIPDNDKRVFRIDFDKSDIGARKSHTKPAFTRNDLVIDHTKSS